MAIDNNEVDECGTGREVDECGTGRNNPPPYQNFMRQENLMPINLSTIQNRYSTNCTLCLNCHHNKTLHSAHIIKSLNKLSETLECHTQSTESQAAAVLTLMMGFAMVYIVYVWISDAVSRPYTIDKGFEEVFAYYNISKDMQEIILNTAKKRLFSDFKDCILSNCINRNT